MSNWYPRYLGDYMRDTAHLTLAEHGAYTILLDHYYSTRQPLVDDENALFRICRAFSDDERLAVRSVLAQFFKINGDKLRHNARADKELAKEDAISKARAMAGAKGAKSTWQGKRHGNDMANATTSTSTSTVLPPQPPPVEDSSASLSRAEPPALTSPVIFWMPCTKPTRPPWATLCRQDERDGWTVPITRQQMDDWAEAYPNVLGEQTLIEIRQKIRDSGKYRKTPQGVARFVGAWFSREQNKA